MMVSAGTWRRISSRARHLARLASPAAVTLFQFSGTTKIPTNSGANAHWPLSPRPSIAVEQYLSIARVLLTLGHAEIDSAADCAYSALARSRRADRHEAHITA